MYEQEINIHFETLLEGERVKRRLRECLGKALPVEEPRIELKQKEVYP